DVHAVEAEVGVPRRDVLLAPGHLLGHDVQALVAAAGEVLRQRAGLLADAAAQVEDAVLRQQAAQLDDQPRVALAVLAVLVRGRGAVPQQLLRRDQVVAQRGHAAEHPGQPVAGRRRQRLAAGSPRACTLHYRTSKPCGMTNSFADLPSPETPSFPLAYILP